MYVVLRRPTTSSEDVERSRLTRNSLPNKAVKHFSCDFLGKRSRKSFIFVHLSGVIAAILPIFHQISKRCPRMVVGR